MKSSRDLVFESNQPGNEFFKRLYTARLSGLFCDGTIVAREKVIKVHRVVLAVASPYFKQLFESSEMSTVECYDLMSEDLEYIISFLYSGRITIPYAKIKDILTASRICGVTDLSEACVLFLEEHFNAEEAVELRKFATQNGHFHLCKKIDDYLKDNLACLYQNEAFLLLPRLQVTLMASQLCSNHELENYESIFEKVIDWVQKRQQEFGEKLSSLLEENNMLYMQSNNLLKDCALEDIEEVLDVNSNEDIQKFRRQTSRGNPEISDELNYPVKCKSTVPCNEYKLLAVMQTSDQNAVALAVIADQVVAVSLHYKMRQNSSNASTTSSDSSGCEDNSLNSSMTMLAPMTTGRCSSGIAAHDEKLFVIGGYNRGCCLKSCESYDPETNEWSDFTELTTQRARLQSAIIDGKIYVVGGSDGHNDLSTMEFYDLCSQTWHDGVPMNDQRASFGMDVLNDKIYVVGGVSDSKILKKAECYDLHSETWTRLPPMKAVREHVCASSYNGRIYAIGGSDGWRCHNTVEVYDPVNDDWIFAPNMSVPRRGAACAVYDGKIVVAGGSDGKAKLRTVECYDDATNTWTTMPSMTSSRNNAMMVVVLDVLYVIGGFGGYSGTEFLNTVEYFDKSSNEWKVYIHG